MNRRKEITLRHYGRNIVNNYLKENPQHPLNNDNLIDTIYDILASGDPTNPTNGKYIPWIVREYNKGNIELLEDVYGRVKDILSDYHRYKNRSDFPSDIKDIMKVSWDKLESTINEYCPQIVLTNRGKYDVILDDNDLYIIKPLDTDSACYYGRGTKWCTASTRGTNYFNNYFEHGPLYIIIPKNPVYIGEKYQFHFNDSIFKANQYRNELDKVINYNDIKNLYIRYPVLKSLFKDELIKTNDIIIIPDEYKTYELCYDIVKKEGQLLEYVPEIHKDYNICYVAVNSNGYAIKYVPEEHKTYDMYMLAIKSYGLALQYVPNTLKTYEMCLAAVKENGKVFSQVPEEYRNEELCYEAGKQNNWVLKQIPDNIKTKEFMMKMIELDYTSIKYVPKGKIDYELIKLSNKMEKEYKESSRKLSLIKTQGFKNILG